MSVGPRILDLKDRLTAVKSQQCNSSGCEVCPLQWEGGCDASDLQDQIMDLEISLDNNIFASDVDTFEKKYHNDFH
jgi:hypothetical protein